MRNNKIISIIVSFILLTGCKTAKQEQKLPLTSAVVNVKVQIPEEAHILLLSEFINDIQYLRLQGKSNHLIGNIDKIIPHKDRFYILDRDAQKSLFAFKKDGTFLFQIEKQGQGPGQYNQPDDFIIDIFNDKIIILDSNQRKLIFFDNDGHYQTEESLPFTACSMAMLDASSFAFYLNFIPYRYLDNYHNVIITQAGAIRKTFFRFTPSTNQFRLTPQTVFSLSSSNCFVIPTFNDTVFEVTASLITSKYYIDFGDSRLPRSFFNDHREKTVAALRQEINKFSHLIQNFCETSDFVSFNFFYQQRVFFVFYNKSSHTVKVGGLIGNDIDGGPFSYPIASIDDVLIGVVEPMDIIDTYRRDSSRASSQLTIIASTLTELSNPLIALYKVKSF